MAYLDCNNMFAAPVTSRAQAFVDTLDRAGDDANGAAPETGFSALEWSVIALARRDTVASLREPGRLSRAMGGLFGLGTRSQLADPRLEALRRLSVHAWRRGFALPMREIEQFLAAGFVEPQIETLVTSITGIRIGDHPRFAG